MVNNAVDPRVKIGKGYFLLDNQADISIVDPRYLRQIEDCEEVRVNGIDGLSMSVRETGYLDGFVRVHSSEQAVANVLSFAEVEDFANITYIPKEGFLVHLPERDIMFRRTGKLFIAEWEDIDDECYANVTTQETESRYTKVQVERAKKAYKLA